ncbi:MAG: ABC transporter permease [Endomicrobiales bacterium]|nr:ABC transporter permease [Endomicrobiales bacterium]
MTAIIELKDIKKVYCTGAVEVPALKGVSLKIEAGDFVAIMGASGSGKSTLLHILGLLDKPSEGKYHIAGKDTSNLNDNQLAALRNEYLGFVFQSFNLLARFNAHENVLLPVIYATGEKKNISEKAEQLLGKVGLSARMKHKPNELSGGQQQRVAVARSLINDPLVIFADEPTGNLDSKSAMEIIDLLKELNASGITIVMVTHEPDLAEAARRTIRLQDGLVVSDESKHSLKKHPKEDASGMKASHHAPLNFYRAKNYVTEAMRSLYSNKTRTFLSVLGVLIGVAGLIAMLALGTGAREETKKQMSRLGSNLLMVRASHGSRGGVSLEAGATVKLTLDDVQAIRENVSSVQRIVPYASGRGQAVYGSNNANTRVDGTSPDYEFTRNSTPESGRFFTQEEMRSRAKVALIGKTVERALFENQNPLGEFIKINRTDFLVIGVLPAKGSSGWRDEDDKIIIPVNTAMYRLLGQDSINNMDVQIKEGADMDEASDQIKKLLLGMRRMGPDKNDLIDIRNIADIQETISATMNIFSMLLGSIAFISLLVGGIGIMNIMLVSVTERTKEIGLRKSLGANSGDIMFQFMLESIVVCLLGGTMGIILGATTAVMLAVFAGWKTIVSASSVILSFAFSAIIGFIFGTWPAKKAADLSPIEALRYE